MMIKDRSKLNIYKNYFTKLQKMMKKKKYKFNLKIIKKQLISKK